MKKPCTQFHTTFIALSMMMSAQSFAASSRYQMRGYLSTRLSNYTSNKSKNYGQQTRAQFEQTTQFTSNMVALNQLRWTGNSVVDDVSSKSEVSKKDNFNVYLGENYFKFKSPKYVIQLGYQEVVWGEAFGFNYADIINPKDLRETLFSEAGDARLPLLLANAKAFFSRGDFSGSFQLLFSPEPRFSKTLPVELYTGGLIPQSTLTVEKESTPKIFDETEFGGKIAASYAGFDMSAYTYSYLSRDPYFVFKSANATNLTIQEKHNKQKSYGISLAKTLGDFVFRTDIVQTKDRMVNYVSSNGLLLANSTTSLDTLISMDTPTYGGYSGVFIFAKSSIGDIMENSFRQKIEQYAIAKISKDLGGDKSFEVSYTHEFIHSGRSIQSALNWPINGTTDLKIGGQFYSGDELSNLNKFKKVSSVFFSLKNYFQL